MIRNCGLLGILLALGCFACRHPAEWREPPRPAASRFSRLELTVGMERAKVEEQVATLLETPNRYSPYGNNLFGGVVRYRDGEWVLEVTYKAGAPAPWVRTSDGSAQHLPPIDETVASFRIVRIP